MPPMQACRGVSAVLAHLGQTYFRALQDDPSINREPQMFDSWEAEARRSDAVTAGENGSSEFGCRLWTRCLRGLIE
jgi:hypothetical protein